MKHSPSFYAFVGNAAHSLSLVSTLVFAYAVVVYIDQQDDKSFFDAQWKEQGFCIAAPDVPYWTSHDLCLYVDTVAALLLGLAYYALHSATGMESANAIVFPGIPGVFAHGLGHGALAAAMRSMTKEDIAAKSSFELLSGKTTAEAVAMLLPFVIFWLCLLKASMPNVRMYVVAGLSAVALIGNLIVAQNLGFTYVQTILLLCFSGNQLLTVPSKKDFAYAMYPVLVSLPLSLVGWMESTQCQAFVRERMFGHVVYDAFIPFGMMTFYLLCYIQATGTTTTSVPHGGGPPTKVAATIKKDL
jgi:hypothetical protein